MALVALVTLAASGESAASQSPQKDDVQKASRLSSLKGAAVVSVRQGLAIAIRDRGVRGADGIVKNVEIHGEVMNADAVADMGFASLASRVDVDCVNRRDRVVSMSVYAAAGRQGPAEHRVVPGGWVQPSPQAYLADVLRSICGQRREADYRVASTEPNSDAPITTAISARPTLRPSVEVPQATNTPQPGPRAETRLEATAPEPAPRLAAPRNGSVTAQVGAGASRDAADRMAKAAARKAPSGVTGGVEQVSIDGRTVYRALVHGFVTRAEASQFCRVVVAGGGACFVR